MFIIVCCTIAGLMGSFVAASRIQSSTSSEFSLGFPCIVGGLFGTAAVTVVASMLPSVLPVQPWWVTLIAVALSAGAAFGGTYLAEPLVYTYLKRRENAKSKNAGQ